VLMGIGIGGGTYLLFMSGLLPCLLTNI
jgi:hypothetical protein